MRQNLKAQQPLRAGRRKPTRLFARTAEEAAIGTLLKPYVRQGDGTAMVRVSFRVSVDCAKMVKALGPVLQMEGMKVNTWIEELICEAIATGYRPKAPPTPEHPEPERKAG